MGEGGKPVDRSHPRGDSQASLGCTILRRAPSAKKPVIRIMSNMKRGSTTFFGAPGSVDLRCLHRKKRVPASKAVPRISVNRDKMAAGTRGMMKSNWAKITRTIGTRNPQNKMRWAIPGFRFFRIFW